MKARMRLFRMLENQKGSSMVMVMIVAVVIAIMATILPSLFSQNNKTYKILGLRTAAQSIKENTMAILDNDASWLATVNNPANGFLNCLTVAGATCNPGNQLITVVDADGTVFMNPANANFGFNIAGQTCTTFNNPGVQDDCIFRYTVTWDCGGGPCNPTKFTPGNPVPVEPRIRLIANFFFIPKDPDMRGAVMDDKPLPSGGVPVPSLYKINFARASTNTLAKFCSSVSGIFDSQTEFCQSNVSAPTEYKCEDKVGAGGWLTGFDEQGTPTCAVNSKLINISCDDGLAVRGYDPDGKLVCGTP